MIRQMLKDFWWSLAIPGTEPARVLREQDRARVRAAHLQWAHERDQAERRKELQLHGFDVRARQGGPGWRVYVRNEHAGEFRLDQTYGWYFTEQSAWDAVWKIYADLIEEGTTDEA